VFGDTSDALATPIVSLKYNSTMACTIAVDMRKKK
jgi:hypothetical protein